MNPSAITRRTSTAAEGSEPPNRLALHGFTRNGGIMNHLTSIFDTTDGKSIPALAAAGFADCARRDGWRIVLWAVPALVLWAGNSRLQADDATIKQDGPQWKLETATMERVIALEDGKLLLKSFKNKASGRELIPPGTPSEEFFLAVNQNTNRWSGSMGGWKLADSKVTKLGQGEQQLDICLQIGRASCRERV